MEVYKNHQWHQYLNVKIDNSCDFYTNNALASTNNIKIFGYSSNSAAPGRIGGELNVSTGEATVKESTNNLTQLNAAVSGNQWSTNTLVSSGITISHGNTGHIYFVLCLNDYNTSITSFNAGIVWDLSASSAS